MNIFDNEQDTADLKTAVSLLETPSITIQIINLVGAPIGWSLSKLPSAVQKKIQSAVKAALHKSIAAVLWTLDDSPMTSATTKLHKLATASTGAVSGFFGLGGTLLELPITTTIMMRAVADVARSEGFSLAELSVQQACIEVFALGGGTGKDDAVDTSYYASRGILADVSKYTTKELVEIARNRVTQDGVNQVFKLISPEQAGAALAKLIDAVALRYGIVISEKLAAQIVPVLGAATGATINVLFTNHYQNMARGHFIVKRLERTYGEEPIQATYNKIAKGL